MLNDYKLIRGFCLFKKNNLLQKLKKNKTAIIKILSAICSGLLLSGAFPKAGISWLVWFALVPLLVSLNNLSLKNSFRLGFLAGFVHNLTLIYWLSYTMKTYGRLPWYLCISLLIIFSAYLSLFVGAFSMALTRLSKRPLTCLIMIPVLWVSSEYVRSFLFSGFPWELIGYSLYNNLNIIQIADIFGVYGISFLIAVTNGFIFLAFLYITKTKWQETKITKSLAAGSLILFSLIFCLVWYYGQWRINSIDRISSVSSSVNVTIVQGNIEQSKKWNPAFQLETIKKYIDLSLSAASHRPDLIVWPETAAPFYFLRNPGLTKIVKKGIYNTGVDFLIGSPSYINKNNHGEYYNSAYLISPDGKVYGKYDKVHLVPFGEYVPFKKWFPFLGKIVEEVGDFWPGKKGNTIKWGNYNIGVQICFEIIFPGLSRAMINNGAALLINITNDAWYGKTSAPYQHFSMVVFRAIENRRSLVRSANTGISGFVDPVGRIMASTPLFKEKILTRNIPALHIKTLYTRFGDLFAIACLTATLAVIFFILIKPGD